MLSLTCVIPRSAAFVTTRLSSITRIPIHHVRFKKAPRLRDPQHVSWFSSSFPDGVLASIQNNQNDVYQELKQTSLEILRHDKLYYTPGLIPELMDEDYDALTLREAELCTQYPHLMEKWQDESGLGLEATRFGGRVGLQQEPPEEERFKKRLHLKNMLSLDNVTTRQELVAWLERIRKALSAQDEDKIQILTEPKLDGLSLSLRYKRVSDEKKYKLQWAATRGNGQEGHDVTGAMQDMSISDEFHVDSHDLPVELEIRGEVVLPKSVFDTLADSSDNDDSMSFSNARNAASGILLRKLDNHNTTKRLRSQLLFYAYDIAATTDFVLDSGDEMRRTLQELGFNVPQPTQISTLYWKKQNDNATLEWNSEHDLEPLLEYYDSLLQHRDGLNNNDNNKYTWGDYDMDGAVHKINNLQLRSRIGSSTRYPKWAVAHKFPPISAVTDLLDISVQVGRTGALTPVAILKPVSIGGVVVQRATLHNFGHAQHVLGTRNLPRTNCSVVVRRAGDVIPQVVQRIVGSEEEEQEKDRADATTMEDFISLDPPSKCPACGSDTVMDPMSTSYGQVLRCGGPSFKCPPRAVSMLAHAFSRNALDINGLSEARIQQLVHAELLQFPSHVFDLENKVDEMTELDGWGTKSIQNLLRVTQKVATEGVSLSRFIYSLGIRHVGSYSSKLVASCYVTADAFFRAVEESSTMEDNQENPSEPTPFGRLVGTNETEGIKGIGPVVLASLVVFSKDEASVKAARNLANTILVHDDDTPHFAATDNNTKDSDNSKLPFHNMVIVFTGTIPNTSRTKAQELARQLGAKSTPIGVSKSTNLVVAGEGGGKKLEKAIDLGIKVMEPSEFLSLVDEFRENT